MSNPNGRWEFDKDGNVRYVPPDGSASETRSSYPPPPSAQSRRTSSNSSKKKNSDWHWLAIILSFMIAWPVGLILLFLELSGKWPANQQVEKEFKRVADAAKNAAKQAQQKYGTAASGNTASTKTAAPPPKTDAQSPTKTKKSEKKQAKRLVRDEAKAWGLGNIRLLRIIGGSVTGLFGFCAVMALVEELTHFYSLGYLLEEVIPLVAFTLIGVTLLGMAGSRSRKLKKFKKYLKLIGDREEISLSSLAKTTGLREKAVLQDMEEMLEREVLPAGYIDVSRNMLVLREGGIREEPAPQTPPADDSMANAALRRIRKINDDIANPELSEKIEHIETLTAKIFGLLEERPEKSGELRQFMNYYLPQTLKILESYAQLEAQGIEGENIAEAKQKIEGMMDKLVEGYETQLDKLFAADVLDISADLRVMETMLAKDGLMVENDFDF